MHKFKKGDRYKVWNQNMKGERFMEGIGILFEKNPISDTGDDSECWLVSFEGSESEGHFYRNIYPKDKVVEMKRIMQLTKKMLPFLKTDHMDKLAILTDLVTFVDTHGYESFEAMERFTTFCLDKRNADLIPCKPSDYLAINVSHDLAGCDDALMTPRTLSWAESQEEVSNG